MVCPGEERRESRVSLSLSLGVLPAGEGFAPGV